MTQYTYDNNELARDLISDEPEILRDDLPFGADMFGSENDMYEGLGLGNDNPFSGD